MQPQLELQPQLQPQEQPRLPDNYGFPDLAKYEEARRAGLGQTSRENILGYGQDVARMGQDLRGQIQTNQSQIPGFFDQQRTSLSTDADAARQQLNQNAAAKQQAIGGILSSFQASTPERRAALNQGFGDLESSLRGLTGDRERAVSGAISQAGDIAARRRADLMNSLSDIGQKQFSMASPGILEDLNRRGLASSPEAVARAQADALKEISLSNQRDVLDLDREAMAREDALRNVGLEQTLLGANQLGDTAIDRQRQLMGFDTGRFAQEDALRRQGLDEQLSGINQQQALDQDVFGRRQAIGQALLSRQLQGADELSAMDKESFGRQADIRGAALGADLQAQQDALDAGLDLRRGQLEAQRADAQSANERALAEKLAREERRGGITNSLIGAGGSLLGGVLAGGKLGGLLGGGLGAGGAGGAGAAGAAGGAGMLGPLALGGLGYAANVGGGAYAGQLLGKNIYAGDMNKRYVSRGVKSGSLVGGMIGGPIGGAIGGAVGGVAGKGVHEAEKGIKATSQAVSKAASQVGKAIKKICFDPSTPVTMSDGSTKMIKDIDLSEETKGGVVEKISKGLTVDGTLYNYKGVYVTGSHAVLEGGVWKRVEDSALSVPVQKGGIVHCLVTSAHRIYVNDIVFADEHETDFYEDFSIEESLDYLNAEQSGKPLKEMGHAA